MKYIILARTKEGSRQWSFTQSKTGIVDFAGSISGEELSKEKVSQVLEGSTYFTPTWYTWLPAELSGTIQVLLCGTPAAVSQELYSYLVHIGALLCAVDARDGLLAAELLNRRFDTFNRYAELTRYILEPIAVEALFAWLYGRFNDDSYFLDAYYGKSTDVDTSTLLYDAAKKRLNPQPDVETPEAMFVRFFKTHKNITLTMGIVGASYRNWVVNGLDYLDSILRENIAADFLSRSTRVRDARNSLFSETEVAVQAEPYNPADPNAIAVLMDNLETRISGGTGKDKAGYIRATGAAILRAARPENFAFPAKLARLGNSQDGKKGIVVQFTA